MRRFLLFTVLSAALAGLPASASAEEAEADLQVDAEIVKEAGTSRTVRVKLTNFGPDAAYAGDDLCPGGGCHPPTNFWLQYGTDATVVGTSVPCADDPFIVGSKACNHVRELGLDQTVFVDVSVEGGTFFHAGVGASTWSCQTCSGRSASRDPDYDNNGAYLRFDRSFCALKAKSPQKPNGALTATVKASSSPCEAKVKSVKFKVGNKVYANVKKKPSKMVPANGSWKLEFPINGKFEKTVKKALKAKKPVLGKIVADLSGQEDSITVRVK